MRRKAVIPREQALRDVDSAVEYFLAEASERTAMAFVERLENAYLQISAHPAIGSSRYALELNLPGMRCWPLKRFPYLVFYVEQADQIDVWRVLHEHRHMPAWLLESA